MMDMAKHLLRDVGSMLIRASNGRGRRSGRGGGVVVEELDRRVLLSAAGLGFSLGSLISGVNSVPLVDSGVATTTQVSSSVGIEILGDSITFTASVMSADPNPTGTVTFFDGETEIGTAQVGTGGVAALSTSSLTVGDHKITGDYGGDSSNLASSSTAINEIIFAPGVSTTTVSSSSNPGPLGTSITFTATVTDPMVAEIFGSKYFPGTVAFFDGSTEIGSGTQSDGVYTLSISSLAVGVHNITADYSGDNSDLGSSSPVISQTILASDLSATLIGPASTTALSTMPLKLHEKLKLTASNGAVAGSAAATVVLSPSESSADSVLTLASVSSTLKLPAGQGKTFNLRLPKTIPSTVPTIPMEFSSNHSGIYHVLIELTDAAGNVFTLDSGQTIGVAQPTVDLSGAFVKVPASVKSGMPFLTTITISNSSSSTVTAIGKLRIEIEASPDGQTDDAAPLVTLLRHIDLKPNESILVTFRSKLSTIENLVGILEPENIAFADLNTSNNSFSQQLVGD
jgi:Bacterial Ig-like domain (group 3)